MEVAGVEEDGEQRSLQRLQAGEMASPERGGGLGGVAQAWEGLELLRRPQGITGELELGDGGPMACWAEAQWGGGCSFPFFLLVLFSVFFILCFLLVSYYFSFSKLPKWHLNSILQIMPLPQ